MRSSIFEKVCPQCASTQAVTATRCDCGFRFDADQQGGSIAALENEAHEEKLYLDYLSARLAQAEEDLKRARALLAEEPESHNRAAEVLAAEQAVLSARGELSEQVARAHTANQKVQSVRSVTRQEALKAKAAPVIALKPQPKPSAPPPPKAVAPVPAPAPAPIAKPKLEEKTKKKKSRSNGDKTVELVVTTPAAKISREESRKQPKREVTSQIIVRRPTAEFRAMQAARAKRIMERETRKDTAPSRTQKRADAPVASPPKSVAPTPAAKPVTLAVASAIPAPAHPVAPVRARANVPRIQEKPRAVTPAPTPVAPPVSATPVAPMPAPAPKARVTPVFTTDTRDCPNCWGKVPLAMVRCRCGYEFSGGPQIPGLPISSSDFAEFFGDLGFTKPT